MGSELAAEIGRLTEDLGAMCAIAADILRWATVGLVRSDVEAPTRIGPALAEADELHTSIGERAFAILSGDKPAAPELRAALSAFPISAAAHRMGGLAANVDRRRQDGVQVPDEALDVFDGMGRHAVALAERVRAALLSNDADEARRIETDDQVTNDLHRALFAMVHDDRWTHGPLAAADAVLIGRFYERFADQAVGIARRIVFRTSGHIPDLVVE